MPAKRIPVYKLLLFSHALNHAAYFAGRLVYDFYPLVATVQVCSDGKQLKKSTQSFCMSAWHHDWMGRRETENRCHEKKNLFKLENVLEMRLNAHKARLRQRLWGFHWTDAAKSCNIFLAADLRDASDWWDEPDCDSVIPSGHGPLLSAIPFLLYSLR